MDLNVSDRLTLDQVVSEPFRPNCQRCPRLVAHLDNIRAEMPEYHCAPVATWGNRRSRVLIVGLAPGLHGANRTGRPFMGDASGRLLFSVLAATGFADQTDASIRLRGCRITNAVRCLPPQNRPTSVELSRCRPYLAHDLDTLGSRASRTNRCIVVLGALAFASVSRLLDVREPFKHGAAVDVADHYRLFASYHPSRLNLNTGRITAEMLKRIFVEVRDYIDDIPVADDALARG